ncbi:unnamed protein product [Phaedon cochleariae]|uniref:Spaetzle domain-containing protein n=1 Tax=Phaedon cochleariae TaxID=80249 RepID=A0A9N9SFW9_PHACE|nr:unnamed protein product [Phaedon cochleariae]
MVPFNLVPDNLRDTQGVAQRMTRRHEQTSSSKMTKDNMDLRTNNDVNISLIHDIFFKNFTKRGLNAQHDANTMVFPSDDIVTNNTTGKSKNCPYGLCEEVENYPEGKIKNFISRSEVLKQYFDQMAIPSISFSNRFGEDGDPLCPTRTYTKFPKSATNTQNIAKILVNVDEYKQGVVYETCVKDGGQCSQANGFPDGYITTCKQKYAVRRLMAVSDNMDKPVFDDFELPSCCVCMIKKG